MSASEYDLSLGPDPGDDILRQRCLEGVGVLIAPAFRKLGVRRHHGSLERRNDHLFAIALFASILPLARDLPELLSLVPRLAERQVGRVAPESNILAPSLKVYAKYP